MYIIDVYILLLLYKCLLWFECDEDEAFWIKYVKIGMNVDIVVVSYLKF